MTHTTTHTTPAADAVSLRFDCEHGSIAYTSSGSPLGERELSMPMKRDSIAKVCVEMLKAIDAATARESALIADRDAIRAAARQFYNLTIADPDVLIRAFTESKREAIIETGRVLAAALAAPAVEGGV